MRKSIRWFVILGIVGLGSILFRMAYAQQETQPLRIAVVNVGKVLSECRENLNRESESEVRSQKIQAELKRLSDEVDDIAQELQNAVKPRSEEHQKLLLEWFNKVALQDAFQKGQAEVMAADHRQYPARLVIHQAKPPQKTSFTDTAVRDCKPAVLAASSRDVHVASEHRAG